MSILVVAAYRCEVAGMPTNSVDYQVRYFATNSLKEIMVRLRGEAPVVYTNNTGERVRWVFNDLASVEFDPVFEDGNEVIGFITGVSAETLKLDAQSRRGRADERR